MAKVSVIVVAAGRGGRFGDQENKVFATIEGQPLVLRALQLFVNRDDVCETILVVSPTEADQLKSKFGANIGFMGVKFVEGGPERWESVAKGLALVSDEAELVAVHDAVRVCVAQQWIDHVFEAAAKRGAAIPVVPVTATLKRLDGEKSVAGTVSREGLFEAQTPQVFRRDIILDAYAKLEGTSASETDPPVTDDSQVVAAAGHPVTTIVGDPRNIKITTKGDLPLAAAILKALPQKPIARRGAFEEAQW